LAFVINVLNGSGMPYIILCVCTCKW